MDRIEFYVGSVRNGGIAQIDSSHAPQVGETVVIKGEFYTVTFRSWALDYADTVSASMCCNIILATQPQSNGECT